ncbi:MAG: tetratricopeptide repeat protein, partial [Betaproteobacteria bacterium]|nr:tetratricopeptide repeat protein [Betaproteobacteria bacterium]
MNPTQDLQAAIQHAQRGQLAQSRALLSRLAAKPQAGQEVLHWLAIVCARMADVAAAREHIARAIQRFPREAGLRLTAANIEQDARQVPAALAHLDAALAINPAFAEAHNNRGILLGDAGRLAEAAEAFQRAIAAKPSYARARANLANVLVGLDEFEAARQHAEQASQLEPGYAHARYALGRALLGLGRLAEAEVQLRESLRLQPTAVEVVLSLAGLLGRQRRLDERAQLVREAMTRFPGRRELWPLAADVAANEDDEGAFFAAIDQALQAAPDDISLHARRATFVPSIYRDAAHVQQARDRVEQAIQGLRQVVLPLADRVTPAKVNTLFQGNFLLGYQGRDDRTIQCAFGQVVHDTLSRILPEFNRPLAPKSVQGRRIRVGFCSSFIYKSTVGNYFSSWMTGLPGDAFETFVFSVNAIEDELTGKVREAAAHFQKLNGGISSIAAAIRASDLDVLIYPEVGMEQSVFLLSALRLAPVQLCAWGHPVTTGHPNIDGFVSCAEMEPADAATHYAERLHLLPGIGTRYPAPAAEPAKARSRDEFQLPAHGPLVLLPQSLFKIHPDNDGLIVRVLAELPEATLVMFAGQNQAITRRFVDRLRGAFDRAGLAAQGRVKILPSLSHADYLAVNRLCDFMIDTLHWSGGNTTLDALASGLPVVTWPGKFMRGR